MFLITIITTIIVTLLSLVLIYCYYYFYHCCQWSYSLPVPFCNFTRENVNNSFFVIIVCCYHYVVSSSALLLLLLLLLLVVVVISIISDFCHYYSFGVSGRSPKRSELKGHLHLARSRALGLGEGQPGRSLRNLRV